jgi:hypothetical protein
MAPGWTTANGYVEAAKRQAAALVTGKAGVDMLVAAVAIGRPLDAGLAGVPWLPVARALEPHIPQVAVPCRSASHGTRNRLILGGEDTEVKCVRRLVSADELNRPDLPAVAHAGR